jgi:GNAT superfamily N-acetyltransferase
MSQSAILKASPRGEVNGRDASGGFTVTALREECKSEVLKFLDQRPAHTFGLSSFIHSNGLVSPHNRGDFHGCHDAEGRLVGVALIGRFILFETHRRDVIKAFAQVARGYDDGYMLLGEQEKVQVFWRYYAQGKMRPRLCSRQLLLEHRWPIELRHPVPALRPATLSELSLVVPAHAELALTESGINPLEIDPDGFRQRCARRIEQGKTVVLTENDRLIFKAEIVGDTASTIYLEGVWVDPQERGKGYGLRCLSQLTRTLLLRSASVSVLVNERFEAARALYSRVGYKLNSYYDTIFLHREKPAISGKR